MPGTFGAQPHGGGVCRNSASGGPTGSGVCRNFWGPAPRRGGMHSELLGPSPTAGGYAGTFGAQPQGRTGPCPTRLLGPSTLAARTGPCRNSASGAQPQGGVCRNSALGPSPSAGGVCRNFWGPALRGGYAGTRLLGGMPEPWRAWGGYAGTFGAQPLRGGYAGTFAPLGLGGPCRNFWGLRGGYAGTFGAQPQGGVCRNSASGAQPLGGGMPELLGPALRDRTGPCRTRLLGPSPSVIARGYAGTLEDFWGPCRTAVARGRGGYAGTPGLHQ